MMEHKQTQMHAPQKKDKLMYVPAKVTVIRTDVGAIICTSQNEDITEEELF